jgi:hypothetical protein
VLAAAVVEQALVLVRPGVFLRSVPPQSAAKLGLDATAWLERI